MKKNIFNFRRFGKYFSTDIRTCWANYGLSMLTISFLVPVALYLILTAFNLLLTSTWEGPSIGFRFFAFCVAIFCIIVTMPVKCYGKITEKQYGSFWLTLPASRLEKCISMVLMTVIIAPLTGIVIYIGMDAVICALDHTCGRNLIAGGIEFIKGIGHMKEITLNMVDEAVTIENAEITQNLLSQISSPWLYADEIFGMTLPFLLGALFFKSGKTAKTFLAIFAVSTATSIIMSPFMTNFASEIVSSVDADPEAVMQLFNHGIFKNLVLIDTISDTLINLALIAGIWFRIKTLKH